MRVAGLLALVALTLQVLIVDACAHRRYTLRVTETVPSPAPRPLVPDGGPAGVRDREQSARGSKVSSQQVPPSSELSIATGGDEHPRPENLQGSSETSPEPNGSIGESLPGADGAAGAEANQLHSPVDGWSWSSRRALLLDLVIGVAVFVAMFARRRVRS